MKNILVILIIISLVPGCLKAKKSPFDFNTPAGFIFGFIGNSQSSQTFSISGNITGLGSGTLILQNNSGNDLTLTGVDKYSFTGLSSGAVYSISVKSHPTGLACTLTKAKGTISANITDAHINCTAATANALYTLGDATKSYWLDYVKSDGTSPLDATGTACTGSESGYYNACIHAGEFKKVTIPNITSCDGITASDSLSAFNWKCVVASDGSVSVISTGLRGDKGLSDLIEFTSPGSFRNIFVTVLLSGNSFLISATGKWWDNSIVVNNGGGVLATTKTIYIVTNNTTVSDYRINVANTNKIALIVQSGIMKVLNATGTAINVTDNSFLWIEGSFQSTGTAFVLQFSGTLCKFNVVRKFRGIGDSTATIYNNNGTTASLFTDISGTNLSGTSANFISIDKDRNILNNVQAYNISGKGIDILNSDNIILNSFSMNTAGIGIAVTATVNNLFLNNSTFHSTAPLVFLDTTASVTTMMNTLAINTSNTNAFVSNSNNPKFINTIAANSTTTDISNGTANSINSIFRGIFKVKFGVCIIALAVNPGINTACDKQNLSDSIATIKSISIANSFVGKVTSDDTKNTGDTSGTAPFPPSDWLNFDNRFRGWGNQGIAFPDTSNTGRCTAGTCQIWDWSLKSTDTVVRNVNACPSGSIVETHQWASVGNQAFCDANYKGSVSTAGICTTTFLRNAVEIFGDGVGNENGICESNEECMYTPNIGAYQGHSSDSTNSSKLIPASQASTTTTTCPDITTGGTITNVKLWKFDTNGY